MMPIYIVNSIDAIIKIKISIVSINVIKFKTVPAASQFHSP